MERSTIPAPVFEIYRKALLLKPLSAIWRGHGSAIFLEFGQLSESRIRRDGSAGNARGEYSAMIQWSWRIESETSIICGSWSDEENWGGIFNSLLGLTVEDISLYGRLPELTIALSGDRYIVSFMTAEGQPAWAIFDNSDDSQYSRWISVENGKVGEGAGVDTRD